MWELDSEEGWTLKNWCFWIVMLENILESPLNRRANQSILKEINPSNILWKNGCWSWSSNTLAIWCESWLIGKDPDAGKDWGQKETQAAEAKMVGWHHWLSGHEFEQILGNNEGQGGLVCCSPWGHKASDTTEQLNNDNKCASPYWGCKDE